MTKCKFIHFEIILTYIVCLGKHNYFTFCQDQLCTMHGWSDEA